MSSHDEEWIERLLTRDAPVDEHQLDALLKRRPDLRERYEELARLQHELDRAGREEREAVHAALADVTDADRRAISRSAPSAFRPRGSWKAWLAAAVVLVAVGAALWPSAPRESEAPVFLGPGRTERGGSSDTVHELALTVAPPGAAWKCTEAADEFEVVAWTLVDGQRSPEPVLSRKVLAATAVQWTDEELDRLGDRPFIWQVRAYAFGAPIGAAEKSELSPPRWR